MSYVTIFVVGEDGDVRPFARAGNNHGFAPLVWDKLVEQYSIPKSGPVALFDEEAINTLFAKRGTGELDRLDDVLVGATADRVWVKRDTIPELIKACRSFHERHVSGRYVETVARTADALEMLLKEHPDAIGAAFDMCSAVDSFWYVREEDEDGDEDSRPYNVLTDEAQPGGEYVGKKHWALE